MIKVSEALRKGISVSKPTTGAYIRHDKEGNIYTCAIGAIVLSVFGEDQSTGVVDKTLYREFPPLSQWVVSPDTKVRSGDLNTVIINLNDEAGWSREKIADWLESIGL